MDWKTIASSISSVAPTLATALLGPVGGVVTSGACKLLTSFLGLPDNAAPESVASLVAALTPDKYVELKKIDSDFKQSLIEAGVKLEEIAMQDRDSARNMRTSMRDRFPDILALFTIAGVAYLEYIVFSKALPEGNREIILRSVGMLEGMVMLIFSFYFGSSRGSDKLKDIMSNQGGSNG